MTDPMGRDVVAERGIDLGYYIEEHVLRRKREHFFYAHSHKPFEADHARNQDTHIHNQIKLRAWSKRGGHKIGLLEATRRQIFIAADINKRLDEINAEIAVDRHILGLYEVDQVAHAAADVEHRYRRRQIDAIEEMLIEYEIFIARALGERLGRMAMLAQQPSVISG